MIKDMKTIRRIIIPLLASMAACLFSGCSNEDEKPLAKAVLASASSLNFEGTEAEPQTITVYADADWIAEIPEWIRISPESGSGTTEVTVSVNDNIRDGLLDNPRKSTLIFKGGTLASRAPVIVNQDGDKYRDCKLYSVDSLYAAADESYICSPDLLVCAKTAKGVIVSDNNGASNIYMESTEKLEKGDKIRVFGQKLTDRLPYLKAEKVIIESSGNPVEYPEPVDITGNINEYNGKRDYVSVTGVLGSKNVVKVKMGESDFSVVLSDECKTPGGHLVKVKGYWGGISSSSAFIHLVSDEDLGEALEIYWQEDFEWLDPIAVLSDAGRTVETDNLNAGAPQIVNAKDTDGKTALAALEAKGYKFERYKGVTPTTSECIYLQRNYLKFGKTGFHAGITFPPIDAIPSDAKVLIDFDWCPMRQGSGIIDLVDLRLIVKNGDKEVTFDVPTHGWADNHKLEWIKASVELTGVTIDKDTKITLRQTQAQMEAATANRWFLDNIKVYSKIE